MRDGARARRRVHEFNLFFIPLAYTAELLTSGYVWQCHECQDELERGRVSVCDWFARNGGHLYENMGQLGKGSWSSGGFRALKGRHGDEGGVSVALLSRACQCGLGWITSWLFWGLLGLSQGHFKGMPLGDPGSGAVLKPSWGRLWLLLECSWGSSEPSLGAI